MTSRKRVSPMGDISSCDPLFRENGDLLYVSDISGFWNIYKENGDAIFSKDVDFTKPHWKLGNTLFTEVSDKEIATVYTEKPSIILE